MFSRISQSAGPRRTAHVLDNGFEKTKSGLAVTPTQMARMTAKGIPVSSQLAESFFDGTTDSSFDMDINDLRGVDVNYIWEAQQEARKRLIKAHKNDVELYGK